ncbi:hypothetical protein N9195_02620 [bacterium]|nr:hypothetical protein [bacterium]
MDEWGNFHLELKRLLELAGVAENVVIWSGNVHFAEVSKDDESGVNEFTSSGMTHVNELYGRAPNMYRVGDPYIDLNIGLMEIDWEKQKVALSAMKQDGELAFQQVIDLPEAKGNRER